MQRMSATWSNTHQQRLNEILEGALEQRQLTVHADGTFSFTPDFFDTEFGRYLAEQPQHFIDAKIREWVKTSRLRGSVLKFENPTEPAASSDEWDAWSDDGVSDDSMKSRGEEQ